MQLTINPVAPVQNFTGIKMKAKNRQDLTGLIRDYYKKPSLDVRDAIFGILDPYMQRHAKRLSSNQYYYDDVLQNMRLNLFNLLDEGRKKLKLDEIAKALQEAIDKHKPKISKRLSTQYQEALDSTPNARQFTRELFHQMTHTTDAQIPQRDKNLVPWHTLSMKTRENLVPSDEFSQMEHAETVDAFLQETKLTGYERAILEFIGKKGYTPEEVAEVFNLTPSRVSKIRDNSIERIRRKHKIEPKPSKKPVKPKEF